MKALVQAEWMMDEDPDLSFLGAYSFEPGDGAIETDEGRTFPYFNPMQDVAEYAREDYERMQAYNRQQWWMEGCTVTVHCGGVSGSASCWGHESNRDEAFTNEVERDMRREAFHDWRLNVMAVASGALRRPIVSLHELIEWEQMMGGWENQAWEDAKLADAAIRP